MRQDNFAQVPGEENQNITPSDTNNPPSSSAEDLPLIPIDIHEACAQSRQGHGDNLGLKSPTVSELKESHKKEWWLAGVISIITSVFMAAMAYFLSLHFFSGLWAPAIAQGLAWGLAVVSFIVKVTLSWIALFKTIRFREDIRRYWSSATLKKEHWLALFCGLVSSLCFGAGYYFLMYHALLPHTAIIGNVMWGAVIIIAGSVASALAFFANGFHSVIRMVAGIAENEDPKQRTFSAFFHKKYTRLKDYWKKHKLASVLRSSAMLIAAGATVAVLNSWFNAASAFIPLAAAIAIVSTAALSRIVFAYNTTQDMFGFGIDLCKALYKEKLRAITNYLDNTGWSPLTKGCVIVGFFILMPILVILNAVVIFLITRETNAGHELWHTSYEAGYSSFCIVGMTAQKHVKTEIESAKKHYASKQGAMSSLQQRSVPSAPTDSESIPLVTPLRDSRSSKSVPTVNSQADKEKSPYVDAGRNNQTAMALTM